MLPWLTAIKANAQIIIVGVVSLLATATILYIVILKSRINLLTFENSQLKIAISEQQKVITQLKKDYNLIIKSKDEIAKKVAELEKKNKELEDKLFREKSGKESLEDLILKDKNGRVEKIINAAAKKVFRCLEVVSGAPSTAAEKKSCL